MTDLATTGALRRRSFSKRRIFKWAAVGILMVAVPSAMAEESAGGKRVVASDCPNKASDGHTPHVGARRYTDVADPRLNDRQAPRHHLHA